MSSGNQTPGQGGPISKRRRVDLASATLRKPFRSPLLARQQAASPAVGRSPLKDGDDTTVDGGSSADTAFPDSPSLSRTAGRPTSTLPIGGRLGVNRRYPSTPIARGTTASTIGTIGSGPSTDSRTLSIDSQTPSKKQRTSFLSGTRTSTTPSSRNTPPVGTDEGDILSQLARAQKERQASLALIQKELDLIRQARRIEDRSSAEELRDLVEKWRAASRQAAEELFELIKGRVEGMGGARAWRETKKQQGRGYFEEEDEEERRRERESRGDGGEDDDGEREYMEGVDDEREEDGREGERRESGDDGQDTGFTMFMMLQSLNIEPDILGWDSAEEKWRE